MVGYNVGLIYFLFINFFRKNNGFFNSILLYLFIGLYSYLLSSSNDFILARKISELVNIGGSPYLLIILSAAIGGISSGAPYLIIR